MPAWAKVLGLPAMSTTGRRTLCGWWIRCRQRNPFQGAMSVRVTEDRRAFGGGSQLPRPVADGVRVPYVVDTVSVLPLCVTQPAASASRWNLKGA